MKIKGDKNGLIGRSPSKLIPILVISVISLALLSVGGYHTYKRINYILHKIPSETKIKVQWKQYDYQGVFDTTSVLFEKKLLNNTVLTYRGYAAFKLATSSLDAKESQYYINECIKCLRISLMTAKAKTVPQIKYVLGKAYFQKNIICSYHYYSDLVVKYLEEARSLGYKADDIPELLGISYGDLGMPHESIASFCDALLVRESDFLLLSIAKQYYILKQPSAAKQYLFQIISRADDDSILLESQTLLGKIYLEEDNVEEAKKMFEAVLSKNENSADAHYGLGVVYEKNGDLVKARAEWRKTTKIDSNYEEALKKVYR
ncbi:MAG: tetratricopeptide repeat protein, partial [Treponema sp.]|nr:tetratricopeptide repeat protein [Candidatus Treponema scatequi]